MPASAAAPTRNRRVLSFQQINSTRRRSAAANSSSSSSSSSSSQQYRIAFGGSNEDRNGDAGQIERSGARIRTDWRSLTGGGDPSEGTTFAQPEQQTGGAMATFRFALRLVLHVYTAIGTKARLPTSPSFVPPTPQSNVSEGYPLAPSRSTHCASIQTAGDPRSSGGGRESLPPEGSLPSGIRRCRNPPGPLPNSAVVSSGRVLAVRGHPRMHAAPLRGSVPRAAADSDGRSRCDSVHGLPNRRVFQFLDVVGFGQPCERNNKGKDEGA
ncbi:uncharacterized protein PSFLO_00246 [Pseudozyma flocculosa]|uniref:Uncharacterized protein n=1 Tax=Pseudozyma flocculosa TaxID=84751 RepID=A0A5C3ESS4_9BASI|nr:uncharacterized protein PSFLO_00246 [Pseudozyma flocculosa]